MVFSYTNKYLKTTIHILVWVVLIALPYIVNSNLGGGPPRMLSHNEENKFTFLNLVSYSFWIGIFYINSSLLIPKLFYQKKYTAYSLIIILLYGVVVGAHLLVFKLMINFMPFNIPRSVWVVLPAFVLTLAASTTYTMIADRINVEKRNLEKDKETMKTELAFLRSQISPHFIFNVLNNIVALVRLKSDELEPTIMKLSGLMQYMLYETDEEKVTIKTEVEYLLSYIDLQMQRFGSKVDIETTTKLYNEYQEIEPMLLIPFVENAFKHGIGLVENPSITVKLTTDASQLKFSVINKYNAASEETKDGSSGIGIVNVSRRLELLYGKDHELKIVQQNNWFMVNLLIKLN